MTVFNLWMLFVFSMAVLLPAIDGEDLTDTRRMCDWWRLETHNLNISMDIADLLATTGSCFCRLNFSESAVLEIQPHEVMSDCQKTWIATSNNSYTFVCENDKIILTHQTKVVSPRDEIWIGIITSSVSDSPISGYINLQFYDRTARNFYIECFGPNTNSSPPTLPYSTSTAQRTTVIQGTAPTTLAPQETLSTTTTTKQMTSSSTTTTTTTTTTTKPTTPTRMKTTEMATGRQKMTQKLSTPESSSIVPVTAGSAAGGVLLIGLVVLAVVFWRRRGKKQANNSNTDIPEDGSKRDDILSVENALYNRGDDCTDIPISQKNMLKEHSEAHTCDNSVAGRGTPASPEEGSTEVKEKVRVEAPSGDVYTLADKSVKVEEDPEDQINHGTAPSGDVYAIVDKSK